MCEDEEEDDDEDEDCGCAWDEDDAADGREGRVRTI